MEKYPELYTWKKKKASAPFTLSCIYHFLAILYYMGVVNLPLKGDYWSSHPCKPRYSVMTKLGMSCNCFYFMWQHFHIYDKDDIHVEEEEGGDKENISKEEDMTDELYLECVVHDKEKDNYESDKENEEDCDAGESNEGSPGETKQVRTIT
eukprot:117726-Ditylum_brightwellii.AAC.1